MSLSKIKRAPRIKIMINVGFLFDVVTGTYCKGINGNHILNGGISFLNGYTGIGNLGKSTLLHTLQATAAYRMGEPSNIVTYDTETNVHEWRLKEIVKKVGVEDPDSWFDSDDPKWVVTDTSVYKAEEFTDVFVEFLKEKMKSKVGDMATVPFIDRDGKPMRIPWPSFAEVDSISNFKTSRVNKIVEENDLGDSKQNTYFMAAGLDKTKFLDIIDPFLKASYTYAGLVAHFGEKLEMAAQPHQQSMKTLQHVKQGQKIKGVPQNFTYMTLNCWHLMKSTTLQHTDSTTLYPRDTQDRPKNDQDLQLVTIKNLRGKSGVSGITLELVMSQKEGFLSGLTEFHYIKTNGRFGLKGDNTNYVCVLMPEEALSRTKIRSKLDTNPKLANAIHICAELLQLVQFHQGRIHPDLFCTPEQLYEDIKKQGYDWDMLLSCRTWWCPEGVHQDKLELTTYDLLMMRIGHYHPYWLEDDKKTIKAKYTKHLTQAN